MMRERTSDATQSCARVLWCRHVVSWCRHVVSWCRVLPVTCRVWQVSPVMRLHSPVMRLHSPLMRLHTDLSWWYSHLSPSCDEIECLQFNCLMHWVLSYAFGVTCFLLYCVSHASSSPLRVPWLIRSFKCPVMPPLGRVSRDVLCAEMEYRMRWSIAFIYLWYGIHLYVALHSFVLPTALSLSLYVCF